MAPVKNGQVILNEVPKAGIIPGQTTVYREENLDIDATPLNGGFLVKTLTFSIDPVIFGRMKGPPPFGYTLGGPINNLGGGRVLRSEHPSFKVGDLVTGMMNFEEYVVVPAAQASMFETVDSSISLSARMGAAGLSGKTAYYGWKAYAPPSSKGNVCFVSSGAGAVGSIVIQLAKRDGYKVIASAGTDEKVSTMKDLGADVAFNYKTTATKDVLAKEGLINVYWDNVGGATLEAAIDAAAPRAHFIECGMLSGYLGESYHIKNLFMTIPKEVQLHGFIAVGWMEENWGREFRETMPKLIASGEIKYKEELIKGLDKAAEAVTAQLEGKNVGKPVLIVADE
ncbi:alcohol dehydrogenase [Coniophora puteana RWD-64-598 SS2]|uniref:Alcohol dehydrogenase n=1 Tax=Coniophora puteana (strain RWD-64-598) TaxID=741705 RepID=A0A5M3MQH2_CONPW|nr:alcohol dehydrogenase [Coniophora puteana RWD-64-598 SS2]EIW81320.1 alcohol dehydrogenase [Coniophora puteana RWD-64-598 SS2]